MAPKIIGGLPRKGEKVRISNYYGDEPSREMRDFCGRKVMEEVKKVQNELRQPDNTRVGKKVFFRCDDGNCFHIYCGHNKSKTRPGLFLYNVYRHPADAKSGK